MKQTVCTVTANSEVMPGVRLMWMEAPTIACSLQPGQFVTLRCANLTLRRPFSIHRVGRHDVIASTDADRAEQSQIALLFKVTGKGTLWLSQRQAGEAIDVLGPLGNGFTLPATKPGEGKHLLLLAGGIGIAPLVLLIQHIIGLSSSQASAQHRITLVHGASTAAQLYTGWRELTAISDRGVQFIRVTEDGSKGRKGMVTDVLPDFLDWADQVYACGPAAMYEAMADLIPHSEEVPTGSGRLKPLAQAGVRAESKLSKCQVSLEVRLGCGFGACYGCTIDTRRGPRQVCRDGPVFELGDIIWQEVRL